MIALQSSTFQEFDASASPQTVGFDAAGSGGSLLVVVVHAKGVSTPPSLGVTDNKGNGAYAEASLGTNGNDRVSVFYYANGASGVAMQFTVTASDDCSMAICAMEFSGVAQASALYDAASASAGAPSTPSVSVGAADSSSLIIGLAGVSVAVTSAAGWSEVANNSGSFSFVGMAVQYKISGAEAVLWSGDDSSDWAAAAASFQAAATPKAPYFYE